MALAARVAANRAERTRSCQQCGTVFVGRKKGAKFCSNPCKFLAKQFDRRCQTPGCNNLHRARGLCASCYAPAYWQTKGGRPTAPWDDNGRDHYHRRRARKQGTSSNGPVRRAAVIERDQGICQLCWVAVDIKATYPAKFGPSLDHTIPLAAGGTHTMSNVALAHLHCNLRKGRTLLPTG